MELRQLTEKVYYLADRTNIGVVRGETGVILIDAGIDRDAAKKADKILQQNQMKVVAVVNSHSHADHCGGDAYFRERGARIYAPEFEAAIIENPDLEPMYLFSGSRPPEELMNKFLRGEPCRVDEVFGSGQGRLCVDSAAFDVIPLPGHSPRQTGYQVDGVLFCADAMFSEETLAKHKIPYHTDIAESRKTLERLKGMGCNWYVPSHAEASQNIDGLVDANMRNMQEVENWFLKNSSAGTADEYTTRLTDAFGIAIGNFQQYALMHTVTLAWLGYMKQEGKFKAAVSGNRLEWLGM